MEINDAINLLREFDSLPKTVKEPTYLEICKYPKRRFEEICSRLLCFYLAPKKEHGFGDLFLRSLFELLAPDKTDYIQNENIKILNEENAEGKKIDMLVYSEKVFAIGIENKITAGLYNPLDIYKTRIHQYGGENIFRVILSLRKFSGRDELHYIKTHDFINITYKEYFLKIRQNLPSYMEKANEKYLYFLTDFIETLENMEKNNALNEELSDYFYDNSEKIDELIALYNEYNNKISNKHVERIAEIIDKIKALTQNDNWWAYEGWALIIQQFNANKSTIGIESYYEHTKENPLGIFTIYITAWNLKDWSHYEESLLKQYPNCELNKVDGRAFLIVATIMNDDEEQILTTLKQHYDYMVTLTGELGQLN